MYTNIPQSSFKKIPGSPIGYWADNETLTAFSEWEPLRNFASCYSGLITKGTTENIRYLHEISSKDISAEIECYEDSISISRRWVPLIHQIPNTGFLGVTQCVVNFESGGRKYAEVGGSLRNKEKYFKECIAWADVGSGRNRFGFFKKL
jgi:hypothetical protein